MSIRAAINGEAWRFARALADMSNVWHERMVEILTGLGIEERPMTTTVVGRRVRTISEHDHSPAT